MKKKIMAVCLTVCLAAVAVIGGTLAYFTDKDEAENVFTVGNVNIDLSFADIGINGDVLDESSINRHADDNEKRLECQSKQGTQIVLSHIAAVLINHCSHRYRCNGGHEIYFYHASVGDDEDTDCKRPCADADKQALEPQTDERPDVHFHKPLFQIDNNRTDVNGGVA